MRMLLFLGLCILVCASTCDREESFRRELTIASGEFANFPSEGLYIRLTAVNDSRCPLDVVCVWAGEARAIFQVEKDGAEETLELKAQGLCQDEAGSCGEEKILRGYRFQLLFVYPYPKEGLVIEPADYSVRLVIEKI